MLFFSECKYKKRTRARLLTQPRNTYAIYRIVRSSVGAAPHPPAKRGEGRGLERFDNAPQGRLPRQQDQVRVHHVPSCKLERAISFQGREILHALRFHFHVVERIPRVDRDAEGNDHGDEDGDLILEGARELQRNHSSRDGMRHGGCKCGPAA
eukprot:scaffold442_cov268-Pinguiococcus_pyrenoidosus.AAC.95